MYSSLRAAPLPPKQTPAAPPAAVGSRNTVTPSSPATQRSAKGPLPKPPSTHSLRQAYSNQASSQTAVSRSTGNGSGNGNGNGDSPKNGKGNEIYGTIRNAAPAIAVAASAHARDRALHGSDSGGPPSPINAERNTKVTAPQQVRGSSFPQGEVGMDDLILDGVIIPAIESVSED